MTTNFFSMIQSLNVQGDWKISIAKEEAGKLIISVLFFNEKTGDDARKIVPPMVFKGTAEEIDNGFFDAISNPVKKADQLFTNMEQYLKQLEQAQIQSKMEKEKSDKEKKERDERKKKYEAVMKKVAELEEKKKIGEAIGAMPKPEDFPEQAEEIKKKTDELWKQHSQLALL